MSELSMFWEGSTIGDATSAPYDGSTEFARVLLALSGTLGSSNAGGVFLGNAEGVLTLSGGGSPLSLSAGQAIVWGSWYHNDAPLSVAIPTPVSATRKDLLVLRKDWTAQTVRVVRIAGVEGGGIPAPTQSVGTIWDLPLWVIQVTTAGVVTLLDGRSVLGGSGAGFSTGDLKHTYRSSADPGWVISYGQTVDASLGTSYSDLWVYANANSLIGAGLPFSGTRTALVLPNLKDMALVGYDKMGDGLVRGDAYAIAALANLGNVTGEPAHALARAEQASGAYTAAVSNPAVTITHHHAATGQVGSGNTSGGQDWTFEGHAGSPITLQTQDTAASGALNSAAVSVSGDGFSGGATGGAHNNVQPSHGCNIMIKL